MDLTIIWVLVFAWAASSAFYLRQIYKIAHAKRLSIFSPLSRYNRTLRNIIRNLFIRILIVTILLMLAIAFILFSRPTSALEQ